MDRKNKFKIIMYINILILLFLVFYKGYLLLYYFDYEAKNVKTIEKIKKINDKEISFAVFGNIKSSISIFDKDIVKKVNKDKSLDFAISNGDSILDGFEDKYRILNESIEKLKIPMIVGIGDREITNDGDERFYSYFGPFYFSFQIKDNFFIFLDTSGKTSKKWQKKWVLKQLNTSKKFKNTFVFMNKSPIKLKVDTFFDEENNYILDKDYKKFLLDNFSKYNVKGVFSSVAGMYNKKTINGVDYIISGASGGTLVAQEKSSFYHYVKVNIKDNKVNYEIIKTDNLKQSIFTKIIENIWIYIHSVFYINYLNFIIILASLVLLIIYLYKKASKDVDYYRDFSKINKIDEDKKLNILMITNNYLPFIGGVPISINRLKRGLEKQDHIVKVIAPKYPDLKSNEKDVIRINLLKYYKSKEFEFPISNIFSKKIKKEVKNNDYDIIHVHHPFWLGKKGLNLGLKNNIPVVLTYHTRLEEYAHFLPVFKLVFKNILSHKIIKNFAQKCSTIISPTYSAKEYLSNIGVSRKKYVIPTGIDFEKYQFSNKEITRLKNKFIKKDEKLLCTVSRLSDEKNLFFLLKSIKYIKENTNNKFKHIIIGDGGQKEKIEKYIKENNLKNNIKLLGKVSPEEIPKYYLASDIFVFSSLSETQGMVILEAMAGKTPAVAIRASGIDDVIENKYNGFKTKANIKSWSKKVILLMDDKSLLNQMKKNSYAYASKYSIDKIGKKVQSAYYKSINEQKYLKNK
ncbi:MAG: glycosyltransferase [Bacillota bacterium]